VQALRGTNQVLYFSNQLIGRAREQLAKLGLGIKPVAHGTYTVLGHKPVARGGIRGSLSPQELDGIDAHLVNNAGKVFKLRGATHVHEHEDQGLLRNLAG